jgi:hypothetical protein
MSDITQKYLRRLFELTPDGELIWQEPTAPAVKKGDVAGCKHSSGIWRIHIKGKWYYRSHLAYMYKYGRSPPSEIIHKDGDILNDRPENLRKILYFPKNITQEALRQAFWLDHSTGELYRWVEERGSRVLEENPAGSRDPQQRCEIHIRGQRILRSRLVYLYVHGGKFPDQVNHINNNVTDDRPKNLRPATISQRNRARRGNLGRDLPKGVGQQSVKCNRPFYARINFGPKQHYLGSYETVEEAATAYNIAASELFGRYARLNELGIDGKLVDELRQDVLDRLEKI